MRVTFVMLQSSRQGSGVLGQLVIYNSMMLLDYSQLTMGKHLLQHLLYGTRRGGCSVPQLLQKACQVFGLRCICGGAGVDSPPAAGELARWSVTPMRDSAACPAANLDGLTAVYASSARCTTAGSCTAGLASHSCPTLTLSSRSPE